MGFKDANWAYDIDLPTMQKVVLVAICHRTDDRSHETLVGHGTIAAMLGVHRSTVTTAVGALERLGIVKRERRMEGSFRTSDRTFVNRSYVGDANVAESNVADANVGESEKPMSAKPTAKRTSFSRSTRNRSISYSPEFEEFWNVYPRREAKADAFKAYEAALEVTTPDALQRGAQKYKLASLGGDPKFVKLAGGWLRGRRWEDEPTVATTSNLQREDWLQDAARDLYGAECEWHVGYPARDCRHCAEDRRESA